MKTSSVWTALYTVFDINGKGGVVTGYSCWNVEIGHPEGPELSYTLARKIAMKVKPKTTEYSRAKLEWVMAGDRVFNGV